MSRRPDLFVFALLTAFAAVVLPVAVPPASAQAATATAEPEGAEMAATEDEAKSADLEALNHRLMQAARKGDLAAVESALAEGADASAKNLKGTYVMHLAAATAQTEMVEMLLAAGASVDVTAADGTTPLHWSARASGDETGRAVAELLLAAGADLEATDHLLQTPLHAAAHEGDPPLVELLLDRGAELDRPDKLGNTPLLQAVGGALRLDRFALSYGSDSLASIGQQAVIEQLLSRGADVNARAAEQVTALHRTARYGHLVLTRLLLAAGADPTAETSDGSTPRDSALVEKQQAAADLLAEAVTAEAEG